MKKTNILWEIRKTAIEGTDVFKIIEGVEKLANAFLEANKGTPGINRLIIGRLVNFAADVIREPEKKKLRGLKYFEKRFEDLFFCASYPGLRRNKLYRTVYRYERKRD